MEEWLFALNDRYYMATKGVKEAYGELKNLPDN